MNLHELEEGNELVSSESDDFEWRKERLGMITGSNFGTLVKKSGKGFKLSEGKRASDLIYKIAWERLLIGGNISNGLGRLNVNSQSMQHGNDNEDEAIDRYIEKTGNDVDKTQKFLKYDPFIGGTPDGFIGDNGLIEVKCPFNGGNHLRGILENKVYNTEYIYQMQGYLMITDREWCDFITYDPDLIEGLDINIIRVFRDESIIDGIKSVLEEVKTLVKSIIESEKLKV